MAVNVGIDARIVWANMGPRDFAAVQDLVGSLIEADQDGRTLDPIATGSAGFYHFDIMAARHILAAIAETPDGLMLFALGRPVSQTT